MRDFMEVSQNNNESDSKEPSSYNDAVETFLSDIASDNAVVPLSGSEHVSSSLTGSSAGSEVRSKPHSDPHSEQFDLEFDLRELHRVPELIPRIQQPVSSNSTESERHSLALLTLGNTGISSSNGGQLIMQETHSSASVSTSVIPSEVSGLSSAQLSQQPEQQSSSATATGNNPPEGGAKGNVDNSHTIEDMECDSPAQHGDSIDSLCFQCDKERRNTMLLPCRDICVCEDCANRLKANAGQCPHCNKLVEDTFLVNLPTRKLKTY